MTKNQTMLAAGAFVSFFVIWFLWAAIGADVLCWLESHPGTASWVQAIFGFGSIFVAITVPYIQKIHDQKLKHDIDVKNAKNKFLFIVRRFTKVFERLYKYSLVVNQYNSLPNYSSQWVRRYISVFEKNELPTEEEISTLDVLPGNYSYRLSIYLTVLSAYKDALIFSNENSLETDDLIERDILLVDGLKTINASLNYWYENLKKLDEEFKQDTSIND